MVSLPNRPPRTHVSIPSILITGGTGFVGSAIARALLTHHPETHLTILDLIIPDHSTLLSRGLVNPNLTLLPPCNILSLPALVSLFLSLPHPPTAVIHTAGFVPPLAHRYSRNLESETYTANITGTRNVLVASLRAGVRAFVYTSSCCVVIDGFGRDYADIDERWPVLRRGEGTVYGEAKARAEELVLAANGAETGGRLRQKSCGRNGERSGSDDIVDSSDDGDDDTKNDDDDEDDHLSNDKQQFNTAPSVMLTTSLRPATTYGEHDHQLSPSIVSIIADKPFSLEAMVQIGDGHNLWDTVYVGNSAWAHVLAVENLLGVPYVPGAAAAAAADTGMCDPDDVHLSAKEKSMKQTERHDKRSTDSEHQIPSNRPSAAGLAIFISNPHPITFREFCLGLWFFYSRYTPPFTLRLPLFLAWVFAALVEAYTWFTGGEGTLSRGSLADAVAVRYVSGERARRVLGYTALYGWEEGLERTCEDVRRRRREEGWRRSNGDLAVGRTGISKGRGEWKMEGAG